MISAVLFDLDGTLLDTLGDLAISINLTRGAFDLEPLPQEVVKGFVGNGVRHLVEGCFRGTKIPVEKALPAMRNHYQKHMLDTTVPYPGAEDVLNKIAVPKVIVTNKPKGFLPGLLQHFKWEKHFSLVIGGDTLPQKKPHPASILYVEEKLGIRRETMIVVGDNYTDVDLAKNGGARSVFCEFGIGRISKNKPDFRISDFKALPLLLSKLSV